MWKHLSNDHENPHDVVMVEPWWDSATGEFVDGNPLRRRKAVFAEDEQNDGSTA